MKEKIRNLFDEMKVRSRYKSMSDIINMIEPIVNQEVEKRIAETVAGKFIAVEIEKRIADRQLTDEQIERQFTTSHYHYEKGHYYKVRKDRIFGAKWYRDRLVSQKTDNLKENNNNGSTN